MQFSSWSDKTIVSPPIWIEPSVVHCWLLFVCVFPSAHFDGEHTNRFLVVSYLTSVQSAILFSGHFNEPESSHAEHVFLSCDLT
jgi:hypothetical protein